MTELMVPPHNAQAEQSVLGAIMIDNRKFVPVSESVAEEDFFRLSHRMIWKAMGALYLKNAPMDIVTVGEWLERTGEIDEAGGMPYLAELANNTPTAKNAMAYAAVVKNHSKARQLITIARDLQESSADDWYTKADSAMRDILALDQGTRKYERGMSDCLTAACDVVESAHSSGGLVGIPTGITKLDTVLGGLHNSDLIVIGARPAMGKTSFLTTIALNAANSGISVGIISGEQPHDQIALKFISGDGKINGERLRNADLEDDEWSRMTAAIGRLKDKNIRIFDKPAPTVMDIVRQARSWKQRHGLQVLFVDYIQRLKSSDKSRPRHEQVEEIAQSLKEIGRELHIPVVALSQVSRNVEQRANRRPSMADLKDSGAIEQEADIVAFLYRDEVYNEDSPDKGIAEIIIDKNRHGRIGTIKTAWLQDYTRFENYSPEFGESYGGAYA